MGLAHGARLVAEVQPDLRTITGTLEAEGDWLDPLVLLPQPQDDLTLARTYPGAPDHGEMVWDDAGAFTTVLPRRYGALGAIRGRGLWANGGWHPQVEGLPVLDWEVELTLPEGTVGVVNGTAGEGTLVWSGRAERLSIAVLDGNLRDLGDGLVVLDTGPHRPRRDAELVLAHEGVEAGPVVVVEAPMHRRLVRPGQGVLFVSDLAYRTPRWLHRFHRGPVGAGLIQAGAPLEDDWASELVAAVDGASWRAEAERIELGRLIRLGAFVPIVDYVIYSGTLPFHAEIFDETHLGDPLEDDVRELFEPRITGRVLATKLDDAHGPGTARAVVDALDEDLGAACVAIGVDEAFLESWRVPYPEQDVRLAVERIEGDWQVGIARLAPRDAPPEVLRYTIDGESRAWEMPPGTETTRIPLDGAPRRVVLDPDDHVLQTDRAFDRWPARITPVGTVYPDTINVSQSILVGVATVQLRRQYDTRSALTLAASTGETDLAAGYVAYHRFFGPLKDRRTRTQRLTAWSATTWLSPGFATTAAGRYTLASGLSWRRDTRVSRAFPLSGSALSAAVELGGVPESGRTWTGLSGAALTVASPHPRVVFAGRLSGGVATGFVEHRLLSLGGSSALRSLPPSSVLGHQRGLVSGELRVRPVRNASIPLLWLYWLDEVQLTGGVEGGVVGAASPLVDGELVDPELSGTAWVLGGTAGVLVTTDGLGVIPWTVGATLGVPFASQGVGLAGPQLYLRLGQEF
ncbi:MAG: hypothetical protein GY913_06195 [Proteobacteria bacterium]|nr:hypothetical protein [Pseudomonadota bacterium]MCP4916497.1 hypothetical protein [Pseudomonadota bacterium]